jgi:hypothetical protein
MTAGGVKAGKNTGDKIAGATKDHGPSRRFR